MWRRRWVIASEREYMYRRGGVENHAGLFLSNFWRRMGILRTHRRDKSQPTLGTVECSGRGSGSCGSGIALVGGGLSDGATERGSETVVLPSKSKNQHLRHLPFLFFTVFQIFKAAIFWPVDMITDCHSRNLRLLFEFLKGHFNWPKSPRRLY